MLDSRKTRVSASLWRTVLQIFAFFSHHNRFVRGKIQGRKEAHSAQGSDDQFIPLQTREIQPHMRGMVQ